MPSKTVTSFLVYDFETGGLKSTKNAIVEVAMVAIAGDSLKEIGRFETKIQYQYSHLLQYEDAAMKVHGITIEELMNGMPVKEAMQAIVSLFEEAKKHCIGKFAKPILVGHNIQDFDNDFLMALADYCKVDLSKLLTGRKDHYGNFQPASIDTLHLARMKWQDDDTMNDFKLATAIEKSGLELSDAHRAMNDVLANKDLFVQLANEFRIDNSGVVGLNKRQRVREYWQF